MLKKTLFILAAFAVFSLQTAFSQGLINGVVVDAIDGRTLTVLNGSNNKITVRLRYLEVPEPEQPLAEVVKNHLKSLAVGKKIYVTNVRIFDNYTLGVGMINERTSKFDLSEQMIRDGAGWFDIFDDDSATETANIYQVTESTAKTEKLGVWGIAGMKTPWDFRNEKIARKVGIVSKPTPIVEEKKLADKTLAELVKTSANSNLGNGLGKLPMFDFEYKIAKPVSETQVAENETKSKTTANNGNSANDLNEVYFAQLNHGAISTKPYEFSYQVGSKTQRLMAMFVYDYSKDGSNKNVGKIGLLVMSEFTGTEFLHGKNVSVTLDGGKRITLGVGKYAKGKRSEGVVFENLNRDEVLSILNSNSITIGVGKYKKKIDDSYKQTIDNFVSTLQ